MAQQQFESWEKSLDALLAQKKWQEAYRSCNNVLKFDPTNKAALRYKIKIEREVDKLNEIELKNDIVKLRENLKEGRYKDYSELFETLSKFKERFGWLETELNKLSKQYELAMRKEAEQLFAGKKLVIDKLVSEKKYSEAIDTAKKLEAPIKYVTAIKNTWVSDELSKNKQLLESENLIEIIKLYTSLLLITPDNRDIAKKLLKAKNKLSQKRLNDKNDILYSLHEKIKTLYLLNKYDQVVELSETILKEVPQDITIKKMAATAKKKADKITENEVIKQAKESYKEWKARREKDRGVNDDSIEF